MTTDYKTMIKLVVATEGLFFLSLIMVYVYMGYHAGFSSEELQQLEWKSAALLTVVLMASSLTLAFAQRSCVQEKYFSARCWLLTTICLGILFLAGQGREYFHLMQKNITLSRTPFGTSFYTLTGFHGLHVFVGLIVLFIVLMFFIGGDWRRKDSQALAVAGMYWHFVDVVWLFVFSIVYVLPLLSAI